MLIPTADELMSNQCKVSRTRQGEVKWATEAQASKFLRKMAVIQERMILERHYLDMDVETRLRANAVIAGTYNGAARTK